LLYLIIITCSTGVKPLKPKEDFRMSDDQRGISHGEIVDLPYGQFVFVAASKSLVGLENTPPMLVSTELLRRKDQPDGSKKLKVSDSKHIARSIGINAVGMKPPQIKDMTLTGFRQIPVYLICDTMFNQEMVLVLPNDEALEFHFWKNARKLLKKLTEQEDRRK